MTSIADVPTVTAFEKADVSYKAYGLHISIDDNFLAMLGQLHECNASEKHDFSISYRGERKLFTLDDFLLRLGFEVSKL